MNIFILKFLNFVRFQYFFFYKIILFIEQKLNIMMYETQTKIYIIIFHVNTQIHILRRKIIMKVTFIKYLTDCSKN